MFPHNMLCKSKRNVFFVMAVLSVSCFCVVSPGCDKKSNEASDEQRELPEYALVIATEVLYSAIGNLSRSPQVGEGEINGDFIVYLNGNPVARVVDYCVLSVNQFIREGSNRFSLSGHASREFEMGLSVSRKEKNLKYSFDDVLFEKIGPDETSIIDVKYSFAAKGVKQASIFANKIPDDNKIVEMQLKQWLEGINQLINSNEYGKVYEKVFEYKDQWNEAYYGWPAGSLGEGRSNRTTQPDFKMFPVDINNLCFVHGENLVLVYDSTLNKDDLHLQGVIMADSGTGRQHSIVDYLRFTSVDGEWKVW